MISSAFVWFWLPAESSPVRVGRVDQEGDSLVFTYSARYLERAGAIPIFSELPLKRGVQVPAHGIHGCIADAGPDAWGQRVILNQRVSAGLGGDADPTPLLFLVSAGPDRIGALDFQVEDGEYRRPEPGNPSLENLMGAMEMVEGGVPLPAALNDALLRGSSIGGARPKALLEDGDRKLIAKFVASRLAGLCGLDIPGVELAEVGDRVVLLVERFDRVGNARRAMVSALTILGLSTVEARYASYAELAHNIRAEFSDAKKTLAELFSRITFNILVSNLDDHARNQSAFWDGRELTLTPCYDICPSPRTGGEVQQVMAIGEDSWRFSQLEGCVRRAGTYHLSEADARQIVDHQVSVIRGNWDEVCDEARLTAIQRQSFWGRQFLNPFAFEDSRS